MLDYIDGVNLLMVNPGFAGQKIVPSTLRKAEKLQKFLQEMHREDIILEVDGNITKEHGATLRFCGGNFERFLHRCIALRRKNPGIPESSGIRKRTAFPGCTV